MNYDATAADRHDWPHPNQAFLQVTNKCNMNCAFCGQVNKQGARDQYQELSLEQWRDLLNRLPPSLGRFNIWGGEPMARPDIVELVKLCAERAPFVHMVTNGFRVGELLDSLISAGLTSIHLSLDGSSTLHNELRHHPAAFAWVSSALRKAVSASRGTDFRVGINTVVSERLLDALADYCTVLQQDNPDYVILLLPWYNTGDAGEKLEVLSRELCDRSVPHNCWKNWLLGDEPPLANMDIHELVVTLRRALPCPVRVSPGDARIETWFETPEPKAPPGAQCGFLRRSFNLLPNGEIALCLNYPSTVAGSLPLDNFDRIWRGPTARSFRSALDGRHPVCARCCGLYNSYTASEDDSRSLGAPRGSSR